MSPLRSRIGSVRVALVAIVAAALIGGGLSSGPASAAPAGIDTALSSWSFGTVAPGTYVSGPVIFVSSGVAGVTLSTSSSDPPFITASDGCNGLTATVQADLCSFEVDFDNLSAPLGRGRYRTVFTISDAATGRVLVRIRYTATVE